MSLLLCGKFMFVLFILCVFFSIFFFFFFGPWNSLCLFTWPPSTVYLSVFDRPGVQMLVIIGRAMNVIEGTCHTLSFLSSYGPFLTLTIGCERPCLQPTFHDGPCCVDVATQTDVGAPEEHSLFSPSISSLTDEEVMEFILMELPEIPGSVDFGNSGIDFLFD